MRGTPGHYDVSTLQEHLTNTMEDKKRKKFGLSLKNAKRLAGINNEVNEQRSTKTISNITLKKLSKEHKTVVVDAGQQPSCDVQEWNLKGKLKPLGKTLGKEKLVCLDDDQDRERILWRSLFSTNSTTNWETMEDLPTLDVSSTSGMKNEAASSIKLEKKGNTKTEDATNTSPGSLPQAIKKTDAFDVDLDYKELPKPCIACYARKNHPLTWSQDDYDHDKYDDNDDNEKNIEGNVIHDIIIPPKDEALDINNLNIQRNCSQNNISSIALVKKSLSLKSLETNEKPGPLFSQRDMEHKKKSYLQTNLTSNRIIKTNGGSLSESPARNLNTTYSPLKHLTTAADLSRNEPKQESLHRREFGKSVDFKKPSGFINAFKVKSKIPNSNVGDSEAKRNIAAAKKEILQCCPICQLQFSQETSKEDIDQHITSCIRSEEIFIDDDEEW